MENHELVSQIHSHCVDIKNREIHLHSYVGDTDEDPGVDHRMIANFVKNIRLLENDNSKPIIIHMNSIGGDWSNGMAIYDSIRMCKSHVTIVVYSQAESMSSIILQAADKRVMMPHAYFMCHYGVSGHEGNYLDVQNWHRFEKTFTNTMLDIYAQVAMEGQFFRNHYKQVTQEKVCNYIRRKLTKGDWFMNANDAIYYGFADEVISGSIDSLKV